MNDHFVLLIHDFEDGGVLGLLEGTQEDIFKVQDKLFEMDKIVRNKLDIWMSHELLRDSFEDIKTDTDQYLDYCEEKEKVMEYICNCGLSYTPFSEILKVSLS